jgi:hypothetical protein
LRTYGPGADRAGLDVAVRRVHDLACLAVGDDEHRHDERIVGLGELDLERVLVERAQAFDGRVVIGLRAGFARGFDHLAHARR